MQVGPRASPPGSLGDCAGIVWLGHSQGVPGSHQAFIFTHQADSDLLGLQKCHHVCLELASGLKLPLCNRVFAWDLQRKGSGRATAIPQHLPIKGRG